jgi:cyanate permease
MFFCVSEIGGVMGPALVGNLVDRTGTFIAGICLLVGFSLSVLAVTFLLQTPAASRHKGS